jgi:hypothetical protein
MEPYEINKETVGFYSMWISEYLDSARNHEMNGNVVCARRAMTMAVLLSREVNQYYKLTEAEFTQPPNCS